MAIRYTSSLEHVTENMLNGFFEGWSDPPSPRTHRRILQGSSHVVLALESGRVVGFTCAISDGFHSAFISLLEVRPEFRRQGIGGELIRRMLAALDGFYAINLTCDDLLQGFYERLGFVRSAAMIRRNPATQAAGAAARGDH